MVTVVAVAAPEEEDVAPRGEAGEAVVVAVAVVAGEVLLEQRVVQESSSYVHCNRTMFGRRSRILTTVPGASQTPWRLRRPRQGRPARHQEPDPRRGRLRGEAHLCRRTSLHHRRRNQR